MKRCSLQDVRFLLLWYRMQNCCIVVVVVVVVVVNCPPVMLSEASIVILLSVCLSVCLTAQKLKKTILTTNQCTWYECATAKPRSDWILVTFALDVWHESYFRIFDEKIACNLKTTGYISMQFYMIMYLSWFDKSNKSGHIWPWPLTSRAKVDGSGQFVLFCIQFDYCYYCYCCYWYCYKWQNYRAVS